MTSSVIRPRRSSKHFPPKAKLEPEKGHGYCLVVCFWSDPLRLSESWQNRYIWEVYWVIQWDAPKTAKPAAAIKSTERSQFFSTILERISHNQCIRSWTNWAIKFASSAIFTWPLANRLLLQASQQLFAGKQLPQPARGRKCFWRVRWIPKHKFLCYRNKQTYSHW